MKKTAKGPDSARAKAALKDLERAKKEYAKWSGTTKARKSAPSVRSDKRTAIGKKWGVSIPEYYNK